MYACARLGLFYPGMCSSLAREAIGKAGIFNAQDVSNTLWAWAKLLPGTRELPEHEQLCSRLAREAISKAGRLTAQEFSNTLWAWATLQLGTEKMPQHAQLLQTPSEKAAQRIGGFNPQELANTAWACSKLRHYDGPLLAAIAARAVALPSGSFNE